MSSNSNSTVMMTRKTKSEVGTRTAKKGSAAKSRQYIDYIRLVQGKSAKRDEAASARESSKRLLSREINRRRLAKAEDCDSLQSSNAVAQELEAYHVIRWGELGAGWE